ncbi:MAG TPA: TonB family protein [Terriglobales bacterium]
MPDVPRLDTKAALDLAVEEAARITGADGVAIAIGNGSAMCCCASAGNAPDVGVLLGPDSGFSGICLRTAELVQCDDTATDPRVDPLASRRINLRSVLIVPVIVDGRLQAILEVVSSKPHAFQAQHREELSRMAQGIATLLSDANRKGPKSSTEEHQVSSRNAEAAVKRVKASAPTPPSSTVSHLSQGRKQASALTASSVLRAVRSYDGLPSPAVWRSLSATTKAGIGLAFVFVLALGWYLVGVRHTSTPAGTGSAPAMKSSTAPSATPEHRTEPAAALPEITVEQNSLSVAGPEGAPKVSGSAPQLTPGQLVRKVEPAYPASARARGISGSVVLTALVTKDGRVANVQFVRGPEALASPAIDAVRQWVYEPYRLGGEPVAVETMIVIRFTPHEQP